MKLGIIGYGVVGKAAAKTFQKEYEIIKYDKYQDLDEFVNLKNCEFVFIVVPTPFDCATNEIDDSAVTESLERLNLIGYKNIVVIKSTLPPGKCETYSHTYNLEIVFNPEFLRESTTPYEDFENQDTVVIGTENMRIFDSVKEMFKKVLLPHAEYYRTSRIEAEMIKCAQNTMLASRVALANMIYDACKENNVNYEKVREIAFDRFEILGPHMTLVPGSDGKRGFGGKCLPKDIRAFSTIHDSNLLKNIIEYNNSLRDDLGTVLDNFTNDK